MSASDRLKSIATENNQTIKGFSAALDTSYRTVQNYISGRSLPSGEFLSLLSERMGVSATWILTGEGSKMVSTGAETPSGDVPFVPIPKFTVSGLDTNQGEFIFDKEWLGRRGVTVETVRAFIVQGDSMEPHLKDGAIALFDRSQREPIQGKTFVVQLGDATMINYVQHLGANRIRFLSANPIYGHSDFDRSAAGELYKVLGRVVAAIQEF